MALRRALSHRHGKPMDDERAAQPKSTDQPSRRQAITQSILRKVEHRYGKPDKYALLPTTSSLPPHQVSLLMHVLSLPAGSPMLTTKCANLPKPLSRKPDSKIPKELCPSHTWIAPQYCNHFTELIAEELHYRLRYMYEFPRKQLAGDIGDMLYRILLPYKALFVPKKANKVHIVKTAHEAFSTTGDACIACRLSILLRDPAATNALAVMAKSRKRHHYAWPELLAFLEPIEVRMDDHWRKRWFQESHVARYDRRKVRRWLRDQREAARYPPINPDEGEECPIVYTPSLDEHFEQSDQMGRPSLIRTPKAYPAACQIENDDDDLDEYECEEVVYNVFDAHGHERPPQSEPSSPQTSIPSEIRAARSKAFDALNGVRQR